MKKPITCLHLADLHFGIETYGTTNPQTGLNSRLEDFSNSLKQAIDYAINLPIDLVVFAGDAYKRNNPSPTEQREFVKHFCRLADAGIPTVMISGNHDIPVMHGKASSIDIFKTLRPGKFFVYVNTTTIDDHPAPVIETQNGPIAVCCLPFLSHSYFRNNEEYRKLNREDFLEKCEEYYLQTIQKMATQVPNDIPKILLAHMTVFGAKIGGYRGISLLTDEVEISAADLANAGYDYVALGHIHYYQNLSPKPNIPVVYPGSIDRVDFSEAEEQKGFVIAQIQQNNTTVEWKPIDVRPFIEILIEDQNNKELTERILEAIEETNIQDAVVRIKFKANDTEIQSLDMKRIHEALKPANYKAGFLRIPSDTKEKRRSSLSTEVTLHDALKAYIDEQSDIDIEFDQILEKTKEIEKLL
jgi:exonuclease SbcD